MVQHRNRRIARRQFWRNHLERWQSSGLSKAAYCREYKLNTASFYRWWHRLEIAAVTTVTPKAPLELIEIAVVDAPPAPASMSTARVTRSGTVIELPVALSGEPLRDWLEAIHALDV